MLSAKAIQLILAVFGETSAVNFPAAVAKQVVEIAAWALQASKPADPVE